MKRVVEKLKCRRGASILLALLFLLVCVLVAMSVLMAAASNAGKIRSNREEQQKYFTLSSALNLVVGELTSPDTYYQGQYWIKEEQKQREELDPSGNKIPILGPDGKPVNPLEFKKEDYFEYSGEQLPGDFHCSLNVGAPGVLPLATRLDETVFKNKHQLPTPKEPHEPAGDYFKLIDSSIPAPDTYKLELTLTADTITDSPWLKKKVSIDVNVEASGDIVLTASLDGDEYISMEARLTAVIESDAFKLEVGTPDPDGNVPIQQTKKVWWKLDKITKKKGAAGP